MKHTNKFYGENSVMLKMWYIYLPLIFNG